MIDTADGEFLCAHCGIPLGTPLFAVPSDDGLVDVWVCDDCYDGWAVAQTTGGNEPDQSGGSYD
jgi:hypothetical protein